jgi:hypothetical protein
VCVVAIGAVLLTAAFVSQDKAKDAKAKPASAPAAAPAGMDPELMAKWAAFSTPGPDHKVLDTLVGKWTTHVKWWMDPAAAPQESDGSCETKWIMEGRYLQESDKGTAMGKPFEGMGLTGFDNLKKKYVGSWIDNCGTGIMSSEGAFDAAKKTITFTSQGPDLAMTKYVPMRMVDVLVDADTHRMEMYGPDKSGKEFKTLEVAYTRAK